MNKNRINEMFLDCFGLAAAIDLKEGNYTGDNLFNKVSNVRKQYKASEINLNRLPKDVIEVMRELISYENPYKKQNLIKPFMDIQQLGGMEELLSAEPQSGEFRKENMSYR